MSLWHFLRITKLDYMAGHIFIVYRTPWSVFEWGKVYAPKLDTNWNLFSIRFFQAMEFTVFKYLGSMHPF